MTDYSRLPAHMQDGARRYVESGIKPGAFLTAVFSNDLVKAFMRADDINAAAMRDWASWLYMEAPSGCHGSPAHVESWIAEAKLKAAPADEVPA